MFAALACITHITCHSHHISSHIRRSPMSSCLMLPLLPLRNHSHHHSCTGQAFELQEMGPEGTGSLEVGDASGEVFWMKYPAPFLEWYYFTYPEAHPTPANASVDSPIQAEANTTEETTTELPLVSPEDRATKAVAFSCYELTSNKLITQGPNRGKKEKVHVCKVIKEGGETCGASKTIRHKGNSHPSSNLIGHIRSHANNGCPAARMRKMRS